MRQNKLKTLAAKILANFLILTVVITVFYFIGQAHRPSPAQAAEQPQCGAVNKCLLGNPEGYRYDGGNKCWTWDCVAGTNRVTCCPVCGNGIKDSGEDCDKTDLGGQTCATQGYISGALTCGSNCLFNLSACSDTVSTPQSTLPPSTPADPCCAYNINSIRTGGACCLRGLPSNFTTTYDLSGQATYNWNCCSVQPPSYTSDCVASGGKIESKDGTTAGNFKCSGTSPTGSTGGLPPPNLCGDGVWQTGEECDPADPTSYPKDRYCAGSSAGLSGSATGACCSVSCTKDCKIAVNRACATSGCQNPVLSDWSEYLNPGVLAKYNPYYALNVPCVSCGTMNDFFFIPIYGGQAISNITNFNLAIPAQLATNLTSLCKNASATYKLAINEIIRQDQFGKDTRIGWTWQCGQQTCSAYQQANCGAQADEGKCINGLIYANNYDEFKSAVLDQDQMCLNSFYDRGSPVMQMCTNSKGPDYNSKWNMSLSYNWQCKGLGKYNSVNDAGQPVLGENKVDCSSGWEGESKCSDKNIALGQDVFNDSNYSGGDYGDEECTAAFYSLWNNKEYETHAEKFCPDGSYGVETVLGSRNRAHVVNIKYTTDANGNTSLSWSCQGLNGKIERNGCDLRCHFVQQTL